MSPSVLGVLRSYCVIELFLGRHNMRIFPQQTKVWTPSKSSMGRHEFY